MNILFIDLVAYKPYDYTTLKNEPLGGTEATVLRVARGLAKRGHNVTVYQGIRSRRTKQQGVLFAHEKTKFPYPDAVVHLRTGRQMEAYYPAFNRARHYVWHHDLGGQQIIDDIPAYKDFKPGLIFVSDFHKTQWLTALKGYDKSVTFRACEIIYNPVEVPDIRATKVDPHKLVFLSSPHKGLQQTVHGLRELRKIDPKFTLHVYNPGYYDLELEEEEGVVLHGPRPQAAMLTQVSDALCLFTLNHTFPETFGLVHAECNAVGVPCIAHDFGATHEVLGPDQVLNTRDLPKVLQRVGAWSWGERPDAVPDERFNTDLIAQQWEGVLQK